ncbi:MAG: flavodoxin [Ruminococcaceae bacterium]|nr:flavodoxin [Oscillospiraceae bacterium]
MKTAVIYWSGTGNTEAMAKAVAEGANAELFAVSEFKGDIADYDRVAFGCPSMGDEVLEDSEFEPFFSEIESKLSGKTIALFGSYGWGDGQWMRDWCERCKTVGATVIGNEGLIVNEAPDAAALDSCKALGTKLAG